MTISTTTITQLPSGITALPTDLVPIDRGSVTDHLTLAQISALISTNIIQFYTGNPNGNVAGTAYNLVYDGTDNLLWVCTLSGTALTAVWTQVTTNPGGIVPPSLGGTGVANPTAHTLPIAEGSSNFNFLGPLTNGQLLIGSTGNDPSASTLTAGANIGITNGSGSITISATGLAGIGWNNITSASASMIQDTGYVIDYSGGVCTLTLPTTAVFGSLLYVQGYSASGWSIAQNSGQSINVGRLSSTVGSGGSVSSTNANDSIALLCIVANTIWASLTGPQGNLTIV